jgi:hypothetical protein
MTIRFIWLPFLFALLVANLQTTVNGFQTLALTKLFHTSTRRFSSTEEGEISFSAVVPTTFAPEEGRLVMDEQLMSKQEYGDRIGWGRDAIEMGGDSSGVISAHDPRLSMTYAEFPLPSLDQLVDLAMTYLPKEQLQEQQGKPTTLVDIGSGCGRLVFYLALTRGKAQEPWTIHGIEISGLLHDVAGEYLEVGIDVKNFFLPLTTATTTTGASLALHCGPADQFPDLLGQADIVFAYSTAFPAPSFSPELGALILDSEWSELLSCYCKPGCVAVTTDRALDPLYGWKLVDRLDVENPEVFGSTGFVHVLK